MKGLDIKLGIERQCHITKQLVHSFSANVKISRPSKVRLHRGEHHFRWLTNADEAEMNIIFEGWLILMLT